MTPVIENILISAAVTLVVGLPLSTYAGIIVGRFVAFDTLLNQARNMILESDQDWEYRSLKNPISDPSSPSGIRTIYMSAGIQGSQLSWQLTQLGLSLKELGHWDAAGEIDLIWLEMDDMRDTFLAKAQAKGQGEICVLEYIADWHRRISRSKPNWWCIIQPWPLKKYQHLSSVEVDEESGEWREVKPDSPSKKT